MNTKRAPSVDTNMRYVACAMMLGVLVEGCGGAEFQEELFGDAPSGVDAASATDAGAVLDALGVTESDASVSVDASTPNDAGSSDIDACDCVCVTYTIGQTICEGGIFADCKNTEAGPVVTCLPATGDPPG